MKNANLKTFELFSPKYERDNIKLGLSRIKKALQELGNPCKNIPAIQIIGTNGKGSIAAYLEDNNSKVFKFAFFKILIAITLQKLNLAYPKEY